MDSLLDTNVLSQLTKLKPHEGVSAWLRSSAAASLYLSVISLAEIRSGIEQMSRGRKRDDFEHWLATDLPGMFSGRILLVDDRVADEAGRLMAMTTKTGITSDFADSLIAATARVHGLRLATLNRKHFDKLRVELVDF